jgi:enoyl-CoA hydratase
MSEVRVEVDGHVAVLSLWAPGRRNALTPDMAGELAAACEEIDANPEVGSVVVRGEGGYFCAGAHRDTLSGAGADPLSEPAHTNLGVVYRSFARVGELEAPVVAAVRGGAVGAGVNLALAADLRIVAEDARLLSGFLRLGLHPGGGYFVISGRTAGREATAAMGLFGEELDGRRAVELGLAWEALPDDKVEARARELAARAGADPALARRAARSFRSELGPPSVPWPVALDAERSAQMWSLRRRAESD